MTDYMLDQSINHPHRDHWERVYWAIAEELRDLRYRAFFGDVYIKRKEYVLRLCEAAPLWAVRLVLEAEQEAIRKRVDRAWAEKNGRIRPSKN